MHPKLAAVLLAEFEAKFWARVDKRGPDECWTWTASRFGKGYGSVKTMIQRDVMGAHRLSYLITHGEIPAGAMVLHSCDNPPCVNPAHLSLGTNADNMAQMHARGRANRPVGAEHYRAKLTEPVVFEIRRRHADGESAASLAREFSINATTAWAICTGRSWKHIQPPATGKAS